MIKGLYFKLNVGNPRDKFIYNFFKMQSETEKIDKIALLDRMITNYINTTTAQKCIMEDKNE